MPSAGIISGQWPPEERTEWGDGPWMAEPDYQRWVDPETGLPCLMLRGPMAAWCGYVGVLPGHPFHGIDRHGCALPDVSTRCPDPPLTDWDDPVQVNAIPPDLRTTLRDDEEAMQGRGEKYRAHCAHALGAQIFVHGDLTFSERAFVPSVERWGRWNAVMMTMREEAQQRPESGIGREWRRYAPLLTDYGRWVEHIETHVVTDAVHPEAWYFGFDATHAWDLVPGNEWLTGMKHGFSIGGFYRTRDYIMGQVASLARQLHFRQPIPEGAA